MTLKDINEQRVRAAERNNFMTININTITELLDLAEWALCQDWIQSIAGCDYCPMEIKCDSDEINIYCARPIDYKQDWLDQWRSVMKQLESVAYSKSNQYKEE